jgi:hypothetical protein
MKKIVILVFLTFILFGCKKQIAVSETQKLNGYWQIKKVIDVDGKINEYPINEIYDFFELKNKKGFHKKVQWQPTGTFLVNDAKDSIIIQNYKDKIMLSFKTDVATHSDELIEISEKNFVLKSDSGTKFYFEKVNLNSK